MNSQARIVTALLVGAAAGAVLGLLFAPEKGSNTRKKILQFADDLQGNLVDAIENGKQYLKGTAEEVMHTASRKKDELANKAEETKERIKSEVDEAKGRVKSHIS